MKRKPKINFSDEISVRTKVNQNFTVTITVMNHTTQDTLVKVFSFAELFGYKKEEPVKRESVSEEDTTEEDTTSESEDEDDEVSGE